MPADLTAFARRLVPARPDLAAEALRGRVTAARFAVGAARRVTAPILDLTLTPEPGAELATQLLHGETFTVYEERDDGFAWGQAALDGYVGYVPLAGLGAHGPGGTRVTALASAVYSAPDVKARVIAPLPHMAELAILDRANGFARLDRGYVPEPHVAPVQGDWVARAERFVGAPYLWGGRSAAGLDCSALVQLALLGAGVPAPRDSDMQAAMLGAALPPDAPPARGDLVFWKGHVGIMRDGATLLHANAHAMAVAVEPLAEVAARVAAAGDGPILQRRRLGG